VPVFEKRYESWLRSSLKRARILDTKLRRGQTVPQARRRYSSSFFFSTRSAAALKIVARAGQQIDNDGARQVLRGETQAIRLEPQPVGLRRREINGELHAATLPRVALAANYRYPQLAQPHGLRDPRRDT
jgi:hypothetical protein